MASPREGFFETNPAMTIGANLTGTLNALAAGVTAVVGTGTLFVAEVALNTIITFIDTAGERQFYTVLSVADNTNLVISQNTRTASAITTSFGLATNNTNYIIVRDQVNLTFPLSDPVLGQISGGITSGYRMNAPSLAGVGFIDSISGNEGIRINTIYVRNPYQHTWAATSTMITWFQVNDDTGVQTLITQLGVNGLTFQPMENVEIPVNIFIPPLLVSGLGVRWGLASLISNSIINQNSGPSVLIDSINAKLSNLSVPATMDGLLLPIVIGCRFTYGLTITA